MSDLDFFSLSEDIPCLEWTDFVMDNSCALETVTGIDITDIGFDIHPTKKVPVVTEIIAVFDPQRELIPLSIFEDMDIWGSRKLPRLRNQIVLLRDHLQREGCHQGRITLNTTQDDPEDREDGIYSFFRHDRTIMSSELTDETLFMFRAFIDMINKAVRRSYRNSSR